MRLSVAQFPCRRLRTWQRFQPKVCGQPLNAFGPKHLVNKIARSPNSDEGHYSVAPIIELKNIVLCYCVFPFIEDCQRNKAVVRLSDDDFPLLFCGGS